MIRLPQVFGEYCLVTKQIAERVSLCSFSRSRGRGRKKPSGLGETAENAARREVMEETRTDIRIERLLSVVDNTIRDDQGEIRFHYVLVELLAEPLTSATKPQSDASDVGWFSFADLASYSVTKTAKRLVERVIQSKQ